MSCCHPFHWLSWRSWGSAHPHFVTWQGSTWKLQDILYAFAIINNNRLCTPKTFLFFNILTSDFFWVLEKSYLRRKFIPKEPKPSQATNDCPSLTLTCFQQLNINCGWRSCVGSSVIIFISPDTLNCALSIHQISNKNLTNLLFFVTKRSPDWCFQW